MEAWVNYARGPGHAHLQPVNVDREKAAQNVYLKYMINYDWQRARMRGAASGYGIVERPWLYDASAWPW